MRRGPGLLRTALLIVGLLATAACSAHNDPAAAVPSAAEAAAVPAATAAARFTAGREFVRLKRPAGEARPTGPVVIIEVFSYACPHCAEFAPYMDKLRAELPKDVQVRYMPAIFNQYWMPSAQAFYAARQLGILKQTHDALFKAHLEHYPLNSLEDMAAWYGRHGVTPQQFLAAATNATSTREMAADEHTETIWGIDATPTLVVGRLADSRQNAAFVALLRSADITSYAQLQQLGRWMVDQVHAH